MWGTTSPQAGKGEEDLALICIHGFPAPLSCTVEELWYFSLLLLPIGHR